MNTAPRFAAAMTRQQTPPHGTARRLALGAIAGPVLYDLAWVVLGPLRPGYSTVSRPVSALAIGPNGELMRAAFLLYGLLVVVGASAALRCFKREQGAVARRACTVLLALSPLGVLWAGIFTMNANTLALHNLGAEVAFGTQIIVFPVVGLLLRRVPAWRRFGTWMLLGGPLTLALLVGLTHSVPMSQMAIGGGSYGLWERALIFEVQAWYAALGWLAMTRTSLAPAKPFKGAAMEGLIA
jgi:hypothetical protein